MRILTGDAVALAREFAQRFAERVAPREFRVTLYGSRARGDHDEESDLDLFVEIDREEAEPPVRAWVDEVAAELTLRHGILFSPFIADRGYLRTHQGYSLIEAVAEEGIPVEP